MRLGTDAGIGTGTGTGTGPSKDGRMDSVDPI
jgi:hypothetical protein